MSPSEVNSVVRQRGVAEVTALRKFWEDFGYFGRVAYSMNFSAALGSNRWICEL